MTPQPPTSTLFPYTTLFRSDACDPDDDNDTVLDIADSCPLLASPDQTDSDEDSLGNPCDPETLAPFFTGEIVGGDRKSTRLNSSHGYISYAVFCLKKKRKNN